MNWREAFLDQARSDNSVRLKLNAARGEYCHQLHYLQMASEKLAKGYRLRPSETRPPNFTHKALVAFLQTLKTDPDLRKRLGYENASQPFRAFVDGLLPMAEQVERLAPSLAGDRPNPEYPWLDRATGRVQSPAQYAFDDFDPLKLKMVQLEGLITKLINLE